MACVPIPSVPIPQLPPGVSIGVPIPSVEFDVTICCKLLSFSQVAPPLSLNVPLNPAIQAVITSTLQALQNYFDSLPLDCPRE